MKIWHAFDKLITSYSRYAYVVPGEINTAKESFQFAQFLFEPEVSAYLDKISTDMYEHYYLDDWNKRTLSGELSSDTEEEINSKLAKHEALHQWLRGQKVEGKKLFSKHMSIIS